MEIDVMPITINRKNALFDIIEDEVIIINLESGNYYGLANYEVAIWKLLEQVTNEENLISYLSGINPDHKDNISVDIPRYIVSLKSEGLALDTDEAITSDLDLDQNLVNTLRSNPYKTPLLEIFDDMQDFLLVDPIHEVDENGFPINPK
jgi:hypothetical protein